MRNLTRRKSVPEIRQSEAAECGLACLAMVLGYHGHDTDLGTLRRRHPTSLNGTTMRSLMSTASRMELSTRALRLEPEQLGQLKCPAILHWDMDVLTRVGRSGDLVVHDPASGILRVTATEVAKRFTGVALELSPTRSLTQTDERSALRLRDLLGSLQGFGGSIGQILVLSVLLQLYVLVSPFFMQLVVDDAVAKGDQSMLTALALGFGLLVLLNAGAALLRAFVLQHVQSAISVSMGVGLFRHMIRLPFGYFEKRHVGDLVSRFGSANSVRSMLAEGVATALVDGAMAILTLVMMLIYAPMLTGLVVIALMLYSAARLGLFPTLRRRSLDLIENRARETSSLIDGIRAIQSIKIFGREAERDAIWSNRRVDTVNAETSVERMRAGFKAANEVLFGIENILVIFLAAQSAFDAQDSPHISNWSKYVCEERLLVQHLRETLHQRAQPLFAHGWD